MGKLYACALSVSLFLLLSGCASTGQPTIIRQPVPAAYLQPCELPALPETTADLSDAFVQAYRCAEIGNEDKAAIRGLQP